MANIDTKKRLLLEGYALARNIGVSKLTHVNVAEKAACSRNTINIHYGSIKAFRAAVLDHGVALGTMVKEDNSTQMRMSPEEREASILNEAYTQAGRDGLGRFTRVSVAQALGITDGLINRYFKGLDGLRAAVLTKAGACGNADIVADAIEMKMSLAGLPVPVVVAARKLLAA